MSKTIDEEARALMARWNSSWEESAQKRTPGHTPKDVYIAGFQAGWDDANRQAAMEDGVDVQAVEGALAGVGGEVPSGCFGCNDKVGPFMEALGIDLGRFTEVPRPRHNWGDVKPCDECGRAWLVAPPVEIETTTEEVIANLEAP